MRIKDVPFFFCHFRRNIFFRMSSYYFCPHIKNEYVSPASAKHSFSSLKQLCTLWCNFADTWSVVGSSKINHACGDRIYQITLCGCRHLSNHHLFLQTAVRTAQHGRPAFGGFLPPLPASCIHLASCSRLFGHSTSLPTVNGGPRAGTPGPGPARRALPAAAPGHSGPGERRRAAVYLRQLFAILGIHRDCHVSHLLTVDTRRAPSPPETRRKHRDRHGRYGRRACKCDKCDGRSLAASKK